MNNKNKKVDTQKLGQQAEDDAYHYLQQQGMQLKERNYRCRYGEIDLIMEHGEVIVFVEVRYRRNKKYGGGIASVDRFKRRKIINTATHYLQQRDLYYRVPCRFDVVAIGFDKQHPINWIKSAFTEDRNNG